MPTAAKRRKKMTNAEKNMRKEVKKDLQEKGILPPDKTRLNRKQFALEVIGIVKSEGFNFYELLPQLAEGFSFMLPYVHDGRITGTVTPEQAGILKLLKIAVELDAFWKRKKAEGITKASVEEMYNEAVKPTLEL